MGLALSSGDWAQLQLPTSDVVIAVPTYGAFDHVRRLLLSLEGTVPAHVPVLLIDDAYPGGSLVDATNDLLAASRLDIYLLRNATNQGFVRSCNLAIEAAEKADVILCNSDVEVFPGWFQGLQAAARSSNLVASASALASNANYLTVPLPEVGAGKPISWRDAALTLAQRAPWWPEIPTAVGHLMYVNRRALSVVGDFDERFSPGYGEEVEWSQRAVEAGFQHVAADTVLVRHAVGASFGERSNGDRLQHKHDRLVARDFPNYEGATSALLARTHSGLSSALLRASVVARGLHVRVDMRGLGPQLTGTGVAAQQVTKALAAVESIARIEVVVEDHLRGHYESTVAPVRVVAASEVARSRDVADVVFHPHQFRNFAEIRASLSLGRRMVFEQLDFIAYCNPTYFDNAPLWDQYRQATENAYALADGVAFLSPFVEREARRLGLVRGDTAATVALTGSDHIPLGDPPELKEQLRAAVGESYLLVQGASFSHKNRLWSLRMFEQLVQRGYEGRLVLAGPDPNIGSSRRKEKQWLSGRPSIAGRVTYLPWVADEQVRALLGSADLLLCPTVSEGFGLLPLEAARLGTASLTADSASLGEIFDGTSHMLKLESLDDSVERALELLASPFACQAHIDEYLAVADEYVWADVAARLARLFHDVVETRARAEIDAVKRNLPNDRAYALRARISAGLGRFRRGRFGSAIFPHGSPRARAAREFLARFLPV